MISSMFVTILSRLGVKQRQIFYTKKYMTLAATATLLLRSTMFTEPLTKDIKVYVPCFVIHRQILQLYSKKVQKTADKTRSSLRRCVLMLRLPLKVLKYSISQKNEGNNEELKNHTGKMVWHCFNVNLRVVVVIIGHKDGGGVSAQY